MNTAKEILVEKILQCYKPPFREHLITSVKPAICINSSNTSTSRFDKIGGVPWIERGAIWPMSQDDGLSLLFLLSIDLTTVSKFDTEGLLPAKGILSFYFAADNWEEGIVRYYENTDSLVQADKPREYFLEQQRRELPFWKRIFTKRSPFQIFLECGIEFDLEYQTPNYDSVQIELFEKQKSKKIFDFQIDDHRIEEYFLSDDGFGKHHLLGYYSALQVSQYELQIVEGSSHLREAITEEVLEKAQEWKILLKLGSDETVGMNWADGGNLFFFIKEDDLKRRDFSNVKAYLDST